MEATLHVLMAAGAQFELEIIEIGESVYRRGFSAGIEPSAWESLRRTQVFLKAPITTPQGGGFKSLNVTIRKTLGLYANVRPCVAYAPVRPDQSPQDGRGDRPGERGGPVRGDRASADRRGDAVPEADHPARLRKDRPLCVRVRPPARAQKSHLHDQRQHHEDDRRPVPPGL